MATWPPITRDDLRHAAGSAGFDTTFPLLVRRLVAETGDGITDLDMPGGSGTAAGGFDGVVTATEQTTFVPAGTSVWELSVTNGAQTKADSDYSKRKSGPDGTPTGQVTYVQAILAPWTKSRTWATQRNGERRWKQVRAYNLDALHTWLDAAPATTAWLAEQLGKAIPGVRPIDSWWTGTWLPSTHVPLTADLVLAGRESAASSFLTRLASGQGVITLGGDLRVEEARAFVAACLYQAGTPEAVAMTARTLFVTDVVSLAQLVGQAQPLMLLLGNPALAADMSVQHRHQLILLASPGGTEDVPVPPVNGQVVEAQLQAAGLPREQAGSLGTLARRSLLALRRAVALNPVALTPSWASNPDVIRRRLLLLGGWDGANDEDRRIVEQCVGRSYSEIQDAALTLAAAPETPFLGRVDERWHLLSPDDAWTLLSGQLTRDDLEAFRTTTLEVLGERDPRADLDQADRWKAGLMGIRRKYSGGLREALAQTLALLGGSGATVRAPGGTIGSRWVRLPVRELLVRANADSTYVLWTSLGDVLTLIAEAAPEEFLQAMSDGLAGQPPLHASMFTDTARDAFGNPGSSPHPAFLWALEVLAWSPDYFDDAVDALGKLAALDPGGQWSNRPDVSLAGILSCWRPNTSADVDQRIRALERLHRDEPQVARKLMIDLIPSGQQIQTVHPSPRFRDWKQEHPVTRADLVRAATAVIDMLLDDLGDDPDRYLALMDKIGDMSAAHRAMFAERLTALGASLTDDAVRVRLFDALRDKTAHHREYADSAWALPEDELRRLDAAVKAVEPRDPAQRTAWLFASDWVTVGDLSRRDDFTAYDAAVNERRIEAVGQVLDEGGLPAVVDLAASTKSPHLVGTALAQQTADLDGEMLAWLQEDQVPYRDVAFAYFGRRLRENGTVLRDQLLSQTDDPLTQARILRATFDPPSAWEKLPELAGSVAEHYWREFTYFGLGASFDHALTAARALSDAGRHAAALDLIVLYGKQTDSVEGAEVVAAACECLLAGGLEDPEFGRLRSYQFERLFALLARHRDEVGRQRVVHIEWQLFPMLGFDADAPTLHAALADDPAFFAELVGYVFRRDQHDEEPQDTDAEREQRRLIAGRAYDVLHTWHRSPGVGADSAVDLARLRDWVTDARERLRDDDRLDSGDGQIGQVLAFAPPDPDGMFPPKAVRVVLEAVRSDRLDHGLGCGILNKRGFTSRGLLDGGGQEWELAKAYREQADASSAWPRTKKLLNSIADSYEQDARREDEEAELHRRGLHDD